MNKLFKTKNFLIIEGVILLLGEGFGNCTSRLFCRGGGEAVKMSCIELPSSCGSDWVFGALAILFFIIFAIYKLIESKFNAKLFFVTEGILLATIYFQSCHNFIQCEDMMSRPVIYTLFALLVLLTSILLPVVFIIYKLTGFKQRRSAITQ